MNDVLRELETWLRAEAACWVQLPYHAGHLKSWADALSTLIKQCEWREIETAPKDGTLILLCNPRMAVMAVAGWDSYVLGADAEDGDVGGGWTDVGSRNAGIGMSWNGEYFDYWLPLPKAPGDALPPSPGEYK